MTVNDPPMSVVALVQAIASNTRRCAVTNEHSEIAVDLDQLSQIISARELETADLRKLASSRLQVCESQAAMIDTISAQRDNANRRYVALQNGAARLAECVIERLNPHRTLSVDWEACAHSVEEIAAYVIAQPCTCDDSQLRTDPDAKPCDRCRVLGRRSDQQAERWNG